MSLGEKIDCGLKCGVELEEGLGGGHGCLEFILQCGDGKGGRSVVELRHFGNYLKKGNVASSCEAIFDEGLIFCAKAVDDVLFKGR